MSAPHATYEAWSAQVDFLLRTRFGIRLSDAQGYDWHTAYCQGMTPLTAAALGAMAR